MKVEALRRLSTEAVKAIEQCFSEVPNCTLKLSSCKDKSMRESIDGQGQLRIGGKKIGLLIVVEKSGQPRFVRQAANALTRFRADCRNAYGLFVAPFVSEGGDSILSAQNLGYVDLSGNCRISVQGVFIRREGRENLFAKKREMRSLYSPKGERVLRALLLEPKRLWKVEPLSKQADVSLGQVSNVKKLLEAREWLRPQPSGFILTEPEKLLLEWASNYQFPRSKNFEFYSEKTLSEIEGLIAGTKSGKSLGALTGFSSAARLSPAVRYKKVSAFVHEPAEAVATKLGFKAVTSGGNVNLIEPYDEGVFLSSKEKEGLEIVSPVQTYLDLRSSAARGEEASEALFREVLKASW